MKKFFFKTMAVICLITALLGTVNPVWSEVDGKKIYIDKCAPCHGEKGDGKGPMAKTFEHKPGNFNDPKSWQGDANKKISDSITKGKDQMEPVDLKPDEIKAVVDYMNKTFKK